jgi:hypothetical protein
MESSPSSSLRAAIAGLAIACVVSASACHGQAPSQQAATNPPAVIASAGPELPTIPPDNPDTTPTMGPTLAAAFAPAAEAGGTVGKAVDPHSLTPTELRFGRPPRIDPSVTYQPDVVVMEHGDTALRSMESNGIVWHFDAGAPQVDQIQEGKIVFATERCVGRVASVRRDGNDVAVILEPVQITDVIAQGHFVYNQPIDLNQFVSAPAPDIPVEFKQDPNPWASPGATPSVTPSGAPTTTPQKTGFVTRRFRLTSVTYAMVTTTGKWKPFRVETYDARGRMTRHFLQLTADHVPPNPPSMPAPPPGIGQPAEEYGKVYMQYMHVLPCIAGCGGIGLALSYDYNGLKLNASAVFFLHNPTMRFNVDISTSGIRTAAIAIAGSAGFNLGFRAGADQSFAGNIHVMQPVPFDLSLPLDFAAPLAIHLIENLWMSTGFSARTSVLTAGITFQACCTFAAGYINGNWDTVYPHIDVLTPRSNLSGVSVGINSLGFGMSQELLAGLGFAGFATGPYIAVTETMTALKQSSLVGGLVVPLGNDCRQATLDMQLNAGVGYTLPAGLVKVVNVFLTLAHAAPLTSNGSLLKMPPAKILQYKGTLPKDCV